MDRMLTPTANETLGSARRVRPRLSSADEIDAIAGCCAALDRVYVLPYRGGRREGDDRPHDFIRRRTTRRSM